MKRMLVLLVMQCSLLSAHAQCLTQAFCEDFSDSLRGWESDGFGMSDPRFPPGVEGMAVGISSETRGCRLQRPVSVQGWVLVRYSYAELSGNYDADQYDDPSGYGTIGLEFNNGVSDRSETFAIAGNFFPFHTQPGGQDGPLLAIACSAHRYTALGGDLAFYAKPSEYGTVALDDISLYSMSDSCMLDSAQYMHDVLVEREVDTVDTFYTVTYRGIPVNAPTLVVHLSVSDSGQRPRAFRINDSLVAYMREGPYRRSYDEVSFAWQPGTDTVDLTLWSLDDSLVFGPEQLSLFCMDFDTSGCQGSGLAPHGASSALRGYVGASAGQAGSLYDILGRCVASGAATLRSAAAGVYLQSAGQQKRARMIAVDGK